MLPRGLVGEGSTNVDECERARETETKTETKTIKTSKEYGYRRRRHDTRGSTKPESRLVLSPKIKPSCSGLGVLPEHNRSGILFHCNRTTPPPTERELTPPTERERRHPDPDGLRTTPTSPRESERHRPRNARDTTDEDARHDRNSSFDDNYVPP